MKKILGKIVFVGIIASAYFLASAVFSGNEFSEKSISLMNTQGAKILEALNKTPGCVDQFKLQSTTFEKNWFFSKSGEGRSFYIDKNNNAIDVKWTAEIVNDGRSILVKPKNPRELQSNLGSLILGLCRVS